MSIRIDLPYMPLRFCTDSEWEIFPHVILKSDKGWEPTVFNCEGQVDNETCFYAQSSLPDDPNDKYLTRYEITDSEVIIIDFSSLMLTLSRIMILMTLFVTLLAVTA